MSCDERYHTLVTTLLRLAGVTQTTADAVISVGKGQRFHRARRRTTADDRAATPRLDAAIREALQIRGHADSSMPSWVDPVITLLHRDQGTGNRDTLLTLLLLTGGWVGHGDTAAHQW